MAVTAKYSDLISAPLTMDVSDQALNNTCILWVSIRQGKEGPWLDLRTLSRTREHCQHLSKVSSMTLNVEGGKHYPVLRYQQICLTAIWQDAGAGSDAG